MKAKHYTYPMPNNNDRLYEKEQKNPITLAHNLAKRFKNNFFTIALLGSMVTVGANSKSVHLYIQETEEELTHTHSMVEKVTTIADTNKLLRLKTNLINELTLPFLVEYGFFITRNHKPGQKLYLHFPMYFPKAGKYTFTIPHMEQLYDFTIAGNSARKGDYNETTEKREKFSYAQHAKKYNNTVGVILESNSQRHLAGDGSTPAKLVGSTVNVLLTFTLDKI